MKSHKEILREYLDLAIHVDKFKTYTDLPIEWRTKKIEELNKSLEEYRMTYSWIKLIHEIEGI